ncbi:DUF2934 domain-containing protein [Pelagibacterium sp. 26DY04]|uniref:DUF2934 domain-containing protein n=1 Tax=Pelagibacterium sp. 26DY04 TaxID=2967130 RepID=UPI0035C0A526
MNTAREDAIRTRAHQIWEKEGRPEGRDRDHWQAAEQEMADGRLADQPDMGDDLENDPGIGYSRGTATEDIEALEGDNTLEGDVMNDPDADGSINPARRGRTNK